jgi:hypothetical protein
MVECLLSKYEGWGSISSNEKKKILPVHDWLIFSHLESPMELNGTTVI